MSENVVLTCLFTGQPDPQRGRRLEADVSLLDELLGSLSGCRVVVFHDELDVADTDRVTFVRQTPVRQVYFQRWLSALEWLYDHPDVDRAWCVDGTDVEMLREPWEHMAPGVLYTGSEPAPVGNRWLWTLHPSTRRWIEEHPARQMLNAGLCGGYTGTLTGFLHDLVLRSDEAMAAGDQTDMGLFNRVGWEPRWAARRVTGDLVHTAFRAEDRANPVAWFRHK